MKTLNKNNIITTDAVAINNAAKPEWGEFGF